MMTSSTYETVTTRWGWRPRDDRALYRATGPRVVEMLDGILTNDLESAPPGRAVWALLLTPKGKILADPRVLKREEGLCLDVPAVAVPAVEAAFKKYLPPRFATVERWNGAGILGVYGPGAAGTASEATGRPAPEEPGTFVEAARGDSTALIVRDDALGLDGCEILADGAFRAELRAALESQAAATGGVLIDDAAFEALRVEAGFPRYGTDVTEENLVQETGWEARAVSYDKGCYVGQEVVVRLHHRGHANRRLRGLRFEGEPAEAPAPGTPLFAGAKAVGAVTSAVRSPRLGPIGLAYVRREVETGARLRVGAPDAGAAAQVVDLPFPR